MKVVRPKSFYLFLAIFLAGSILPFWLLRWWWLALASDIAAYTIVGIAINKVGDFRCWRIALWWLPMLLLPGLNWMRILRIGEAHVPRNAGKRP
jgi:hypothetical protein